MKTAELELRSLSQISRALDAPYPRIKKVMIEHHIQPDFKAAGGKLLLFGQDKVETFKRVLGLPHTIGQIAIVE